MVSILSWAIESFWYRSLFSRTRDWMPGFLLVSYISVLLHSYSSLVRCPWRIRRKTFCSNQLDLHPLCSFFPLPGATTGRHHRKSQESDLEPIGRSKTKRLRQQPCLQLLCPAGSMPGKELSRQPFASLSSSPSIVANLTCEGSENRTSHSDFTEIFEALLRRT